MSTNLRYEIWVSTTGGGPNWEYMAWISKRWALFKSQAKICDFDLFLMEFCVAKKTGRPPKDPKEKYKTPARQLGRVADEEWDVLKAAAQKAGLSFTEWAVPLLLKAAKKELRS